MKTWEKLLLLAFLLFAIWILWQANFGDMGVQDAADKGGNAPWWYTSSAGSGSANTTVPNMAAGQNGQTGQFGDDYGTIDPFYQTVRF